MKKLKIMAEKHLLIPLLLAALLSAGMFFTAASSEDAGDSPGMEKSEASVSGMTPEPEEMQREREITDIEDIRADGKTCGIEEHISVTDIKPEKEAECEEMQEDTSESDTDTAEPPLAVDLGGKSADGKAEAIEDEASACKEVNKTEERSDVSDNDIPRGKPASSGAVFGKEGAP